MVVVVYTVAESSLFLSDFHRDQSWKQWIAAAGAEISGRQTELLEMLKRIASSESKSVYEENLRFLQSNDMWINSTSLLDSFTKAWISHYEVGCLSFHCLTTASVSNWS